MIKTTLNTSSEFTSFSNILEFQKHIEKFHYLIGFLDPSSKKPGLMGMVSWEALREGFNEEKAYFTEKKKEDFLSLKERDLISNILVQIEMSLKRISD